LKGIVKLIDNDSPPIKIVIPGTFYLNDAILVNKDQRERELARVFFRFALANSEGGGESKGQTLP
jgi:hypothetical protein